MALPLGLTNTTAYIKLGNDNYSALVPPSVTDDYNSDYEEGSIWQDTVTSTLYICTDGTIGAAVWEVLPTGVSQNFATSDLTVDANRTHDMAGFDMKFNLFSSTGKFILSSGQGGYGNFNFIPYSSGSGGVARIDNGLSYIQFRINYGAEVNKLSINKNLNASAPALGVKGTGSTSATTTALFENSAGTDLFKILDDGKVTYDIGNTQFLIDGDTNGGTSTSFRVNTNGEVLGFKSFFQIDDEGLVEIRGSNNTNGALKIYEDRSTNVVLKVGRQGDGHWLQRSGNPITIGQYNASRVVHRNNYHSFETSTSTEIHRLRTQGGSTNSFLMGTGFGSGTLTIGATAPVGTEDISLQGETLVRGLGSTSATTAFLVENSTGTDSLEIRDDNVIIMANLPTSSAGLPTGALWNNSGVINIV